MQLDTVAREDVTINYPGGTAKLILTRVTPGSLPLISLDIDPWDKSPDAFRIRRAVALYVAMRDWCFPKDDVATMRAVVKADRQLAPVFDPALAFMAKR